MQTFLNVWIWLYFISMCVCPSALLWMGFPQFVERTFYGFYSDRKTKWISDDVTLVLSCFPIFNVIFVGLLCFFDVTSMKYGKALPVSISYLDERFYNCMVRLFERYKTFIIYFSNISTAAVIILGMIVSKGFFATISCLYLGGAWFQILAYAYS